MCFNNSRNCCCPVLSLLSVACVLLLAIAPTTVVVHCDEFTLGYLTNLYQMRADSSYKPQGHSISGAIKYAVETVNKDKILPFNHTLKFVWSKPNSTTGDPVRRAVLSALTEQWKNGAVAFIGPEDICEVEAHLAAAWNLPMISYKCTDAVVSDKEVFPTFARTFTPDTQVTKSLVSFLKHYDWKKFSIIYEETERWEVVVNSLLAEVKNHNLTVNEKRSFIPKMKCCQEKLDCCDGSFLTKIVETTYTKTRIYVFLGGTNYVVKFMKALQTKELLDDGRYMVVAVDLDVFSRMESYRYIWESSENLEDLKAKYPLYYKTARSLLVIAPTPPSKHFPSFEEKVRHYNTQPPFNFPADVMPGEMKIHVGIFAAYLYDSVILYARALAEVLQEGGSVTNGSAIISKIKCKNYKSVTGVDITIDRNGDAEGNFSVLALANVEVQFFNYTFPKSMDTVGIFRSNDHTALPQFKLKGTIAWINGAPPLQEPRCGFDNSKCSFSNGDASREIASGVLGGLLVVVLASAIILYRNWKYEQEIAGLLWKINLKEIQMRNNGLLDSGSGTSIVSQTSMESRVWGQVFTNAGSYKGTIVAIKLLTYRKKMIDIPRETKIEMKLMREIRHDNINPYIGSCLEPNQIYIVTEYCSKGSLLDILNNDDIKLDPLLIASLIWDLIKGMTYLHNSDLRLHGNLKSSNCVVTSRWVLQVADFGLHDLRRQSQNSEHGKDEYSLYFGQLWTAPEILRDPHSFPKGSQKGDVFSFAIILFEIFGREGPYPECQVHDLTPCQIIDKVKHPKSNDIFRPDMSVLQCQSYIINCIKECWQERAEGRPDFRRIRDMLKSMRQGMKQDIFDNMMDIMEKYANNLEELVEQRTGLLAEEKKKTEMLLHRMLPPPVAAALIRGEYVVPETFDAVTIYFSDIVGFTEMSAQSTPMEVVTFLNGLYTVFDNAISKYDVYKVETIGDAYMVVSGLPIRNQDQHAGEIASMALDLLDAVNTFRIPHRLDETLRLRIGIHTGPVVAGVVGKTMPRYCLFGDTVNTASRMESNGEALKIHISQHCKDALEKLQGYVIVERGLMNIKGKGQMMTYWLVGQEETTVKKKDGRDMSPLFSRGRIGPMDCQELVRKSYRGSLIPKACSQNSRFAQDYGDRQLTFCNARNYSPVRTISFYNSRCDGGSGGGGAGGGSGGGTVGIQEKTDSEGGSGETLPADEKVSQQLVVGSSQNPGEEEEEEEEEQQQQQQEPQDVTDDPCPLQQPETDLLDNSDINGPISSCENAGLSGRCLNNGKAVPISDDLEEEQVDHHHHHQPVVPSSDASSATPLLSPSTEVGAQTNCACIKSPSSVFDDSLVSQTQDEMTQLLKPSRKPSKRPSHFINESHKRWRSCSEINPQPPRNPPKSLKNWLTGLFSYKDGLVATQNSQLPRDVESIV